MILSYCTILLIELLEAMEAAVLEILKVVIECCYYLQMFTRECMSHYLRVFNFLWRAKRMEYILTDIWKGHMCNAKLLKNMPGKGLISVHNYINFCFLSIILQIINRREYSSGYSGSFK